MDAATPVGNTELPSGNSLAGGRLQSLDAYRGLIMISLAFVGFGLSATAQNHLQRDPDSSFWHAVSVQFGHAEWVGCSDWDLVQPSFMFMAGASMAYSYAKRKQMGHSRAQMWRHVMVRAVTLVLLGVFLASNGSRATVWTLVIVLSQIGLGYPLLFLLWDRPLRTQLLATGAILLGVWLLFALTPNTGIPLATGNESVGVSAEWAQQYLESVRPPWHKNANIGHMIDVHLLNWFPRSEPFRFNEGGYATINFIPSVATMLLGLICGEWLRSNRTSSQKLMLLVGSGLIGLLLGYTLHASGVCPLIKRLWTPSWALYSTGWCCLVLALLYGVIDVLGYRRWSYPLVVVGMNPIVMYCMFMTLRGWVLRALQTHLGPEVTQLQLQFGNTHLNLVPESLRESVTRFQPTIEATLVGLVFWLIAWWMHRHRIYVRI